ncbi:phage baseplate assembly protein domain-containing protein [Chelatococcus reniformis]|uniref:Bacteriophage Mu Gp45 N-terminal domain-containing protein n=1 Tax=Chelatococcus reniformis TaxID=1494448 RepID=A0A916UE71_9HYPH|nr:phage baseplate assembly protein [Chelatococcus reniformis]GGC68634.1 hypothetical protein GCM10010994_29020 [Chelatococcus reniformis]
MSTLRSGPADMSRRAFLGLMRGTVIAADDAKKLQELTVKTHYGDQWSGVENATLTYGFHAVPLPPKDGQHAEVIVGAMGGSSSHPVVLGMIDRRHRPKDWQPGEVGLHDDQGQQVRITRDGVVITAPEGKTIKQVIGGVTFTLSKDGLDVTGGRITHDGKHIDGTHTHTNVQPGAGNTGEPN